MVRNASFFQECCPGPGSASKASDSGLSLSFSGGIPGSFLESQLNDPAVKALERLLQVRAREGVVSGVPRPLRTLPTGKGGVVHLFVVYGRQEAEEDADQLLLTDQLLQAVFCRSSGGLYWSTYADCW